MSDNIPLTQLLAEKSSELSVRYEFIAQELAKGLQKYIEDVKELPGYGKDHYERIEVNVNNLLPYSTKQEMTREEIFLLLCAIHFHGVGRLVENDSNTDSSTFEAEYPQKTYDYISENYQRWHLDIHQARLLRQICLGLDKHEFELLQEEEILHTSSVRIRFLAALLRLAIALDIDYTRVSNRILQLRKLSQASKDQWLKYNQITGILIKSEEWLIRIYVAPESVENRTILTKFLEETVQSELNRVYNTLSKNGLHYRKIEIQRPHDIVRRDNRVIAALRENYGLAQTRDKREPYKFLDWFEPEDHEIFFGRDGDIRRFLRYIGVENLIVVYGESGVGKTSFIRAGLIPTLIDKGFVPVYVRSFEDLGMAVKKETAKLVRQIDPTIRINIDLGLSHFFERLVKDEYEFVVFIDQFEESFISFPVGERHKFVEELIDCLAINSPIRVRFVLSIRKDHFVKLGEYKDKLFEFYSNAYELSKLTREDIKQAIKEPALQYAIRYEEDLLIQLVDDIYREGEYNTPHIQIVCDKLAKSLTTDQGQKVITFELYNSLGRASTILGDYLKEAIAEFSSEHQENVKAILKELITSEETKIPSNLEAIARHTGLEPAEAQYLLLELANHARLIRVLDLDSASTFELAHEFLVDEIKKWFEEVDWDVKAIYEMLNREIIGWKSEGFLLDRPRLTRIERHRGKLSLDEESKALIFFSYLKKDPTSNMKWSWLDTLNKERALDLITQAISDSDETFYGESIKILARVGIDATQLLVSRLNDNDWKVRQALIQALLLCGNSETDNLRKALKHTDRRVRRGVATVLAHWT